MISPSPCAAVGTTPDASLAPELLVAPCYTGSETDPEELRALRAAPGLVDDGLRAHSFLDQQRVFNPAYGANRHYWKGHFVRELPDELLGRLVALGRPPGGILIESLHGAPKDADAPAGAVGFRHATFNVSVMATWQDPGRDAAQIDWARDRGGGRAVVGQRRLRQLHAGRRADRAGACRVRC